MTMLIITPADWQINGCVTGPTTARCDGPTVAGDEWPYAGITTGAYQTIAIVPAQDALAGVAGESRVIPQSERQIAEFIIRACQMHEPLLAACEAAHRFVSDLRVPQNVNEAAVQLLAGDGMLKTLAAAIAQAKGGK